MNGNQPKIEIFAPFGAAFEWMKTMLFRPFDLAKWLTIAFAAFISGNFGGSGNFRGLSRLGDGDWKYRVSRHGDLGTDWNFTPWIIAAVICIGVIVLVLAVIWMWISSRGKFIFTDCLVKSRGAIAEPWREYRREGNSYFFFALIVAGCAFALLAIVGLAMWLLFGGAFRGEDSGAVSVLLIIAIAIIVLVWVVLAILFTLISHFMVPVMYRRRCSAKEAFLEVSKLIFSNPGPFVLFVLFGIVLALAVGIAGTIVACATCCIGGLPYISTVLLLPAIVWLGAFKLLFVRQFGDAYDAWATVGYPPSAASPEFPPPPEALPPPPPGAP